LQKLELERQIEYSRSKLRRYFRKARNKLKNLKRVSMKKKQEDSRSVKNQKNGICKKFCLMSVAKKSSTNAPSKRLP